MTAKYKVIGRVARPKPKQLLGMYDVPTEAVELAADIAVLEAMRRMLRTVRWESVGNDVEVASKSLWRLTNHIDELLGHARGVLRTQYLAKGNRKP